MNIIVDLEQISRQCLSFLTDEILKGFEVGLLTGMILTDPQKGFDAIKQKILL